MKADEQLKCKDCDWYGSCEYYDRRKGTSQICKMFNNTWKFVSKLEKIQEKIKKQYSHYTDYGVQLGCESSCKIIDKEIAELKGE